MRKLMPVIALSVLLAACGSEDETTSSSSSSSSSSSNSSSSSSSGSSGFVGNVSRGQDLYNNKCDACHGESGILNADGGDALYKLNNSKFTQSSLTKKITDDMPQGNADDCVDQCAADISAYIGTWAVEAALSCDPDKETSYSPRRLRLLTVNEYQNTLEDLLNVNKDYRNDIVSDNKKGHFPNNSTALVGENTANKFWNTAEEVAAWAVANNQPFKCDAQTDCGSILVDDFLPKLFRGPLTNDEMDAYQDLFATGSAEEAMEIALVAALTSPKFLYRSELGRKVADVLSGDDVEPYYVPVEPLTVIKADDFANTVNSDGWGVINLYGSAGQTVNYQWTGMDVLKIRVKGVNADGSWPSLKLRVANQDIETVEVASSSARVLTFRIEGVTDDRQYIQIQNENTGDHSQNRDLLIGDITLGAAELKYPSKGDEEKLKKADQNAYVLSPYEFATYLSYTLTGSTPDDELLEAAATEGLDYPNQVRTHVNRLLDTEAGRKQMGVFAGFWFNTDRIVTSDVDRDSELFPNYTDSVRESMAEEVRELFRAVFFNDGGDKPFESFYSGDFTVVNSVLADFYGINSSARSATNWVLEDNLDKRGGILTSGAFMTVNAHQDKTSPIKRAVRVREQMLCQHIDPPPLLVEDRQALLELAESEYQEGIATSRRYYEVITDSPACAGCHEFIINPMFGMEDFDQVGQWRSTQKGSTGMTLDIDPTGYLYGPENVTDTATSIPFNGAKELSKVIGGLPGVHECLIEKSFRYVTGMPHKESSVDTAYEPSLTDEQELDFACGISKAKQAYNASDRSPKAAIVELMMQDFLRFRK